MDREEVKRRIYSVLNSFGLNTDNIAETDSFLNDLGMDSLDAVEFVVDLEKEFNIVIDDEQIPPMYHSSVGGAIDMIHNMTK